MLSRKEMSALIMPIYVCPACGSEYTAPGTCGQNQPFCCREELLEDFAVRDDAVDRALRAFNGWPATHPISDTSRRDSQYLAMRRALAAAVDPEGFEAASRWEERYG